MRYFLLAGLLCGCQADAPPPSAVIDEMTREVIPHIERATGLTFRTPPTVAIRDREQVRGYLEAKLADEFPPEMLDRVTRAYRLFGLVADTTDLEALILALLAEQVVGYYDPDSTTMYVVGDAERTQLRFILGHELVHALQDQYVRLDSLMKLRNQNDRRLAFQAVMEGQATLAAVAAIFPEQDLQALPDFWRDYRQTIRRQQEQMPVFSQAPRILREGLVFPYVAGMDFMRWFNRTFPDTVPFGPRLPTSTEQILHPEKYRTGDAPARLGFDTDGGEILYEDDLGEFESAILLWELSGSESIGNAAVLGWDGDRYAVYETEHGDALVWWTVWDDQQAANKFQAVLAREWPPAQAAGRTHLIRGGNLDGVPAVVLVDAPEGWEGLEAVPQVRRSGEQ